MDEHRFYRKQVKKILQWKPEVMGMELDKKSIFYLILFVFGLLILFANIRKWEQEDENSAVNLKLYGIKSYCKIIYYKVRYRQGSPDTQITYVFMTSNGLVENKKFYPYGVKRFTNGFPLEINGTFEILYDSTNHSNNEIYFEKPDSVTLRRYKKLINGSFGQEFVRIEELIETVYIKHGFLGLAALYNLNEPKGFISRPEYIELKESIEFKGIVNSYVK